MIHTAIANDIKGPVSLAGFIRCSENGTLTCQFGMVLIIIPVPCIIFLILGMNSLTNVT